MLVRVVFPMEERLLVEEELLDLETFLPKEVVGEVQVIFLLINPEQLLQQI
jgi:hypothetical protein